MEIVFGRNSVASVKRIAERFLSQFSVSSEDQHRELLSAAEKRFDESLRSGIAPISLEEVFIGLRKIAQDIDQPKN